VVAESLKKYHRYAELALAQLRRAAPLAAADSYWNVQMMDTGLALNWGVDQLYALMETGLAKNADDDGLYFALVNRLLPKWGGNYEAVDRFIADAVERTRAKRGMELYARLYATVSYDSAAQGLFEDTRASWAKMKAGFEDLISRYPHPDHRNQFAYFACMAQDREALRQQLAIIGSQPTLSFWGDNAERTFDACKRMAQQL